MDLQILTAWIRARYHQLRDARDTGVTSTELAVMAGALLLGAGLLVVAIRSKLTEKIGIINGG
ncbi:LPXTG cell wall anchor domain-containing protein [Streptomyces sp. NBC_01619]|uniref:LPXTG cell wall anchor domain-containing protein n=1 Tax=Streptomyces sp. NBC_01619 TaxID=2975901 RepID=UPI00225B34F6|nr:LPXTG cell wall anchor domain-containing protein [Streptomyces sp. NBC_01619]MCX4515947.1 LPXTG cell wall anchor domain-containing protein [Streptomyces sp. NBC_01619]